MACAGNDEDMCLQHGTELAYFCQSHDQLGCQACIQANHLDCKNVKTVDELTKDVENSKEYKQMKDDINEIKYISREISDNINEREDYVKKGLSEEKETLVRLREDINNIFDCIQVNIEEKEFTAISKDSEKIEKFTTEADQAIIELESIENKLENLKRSKQFRKLFITLKSAKPQIRAIENKLDHLVTHSKPLGLSERAHLPEVKGDIEVKLIKLEEALVQFKLLISKSNLTEQE